MIGVKKWVEEFTVKLNLWMLIDSMCRFNFMASLLQRMYYSLFSFPKTVQLHINSKCNYNCAYCYGKKIKPLKMEKWLSILDEAQSLGVSYIDILGGEPFLDEGLERILNYAISKRFKLTIYTNGVLINDSWIKKLKLLKEDIIVSVKYGYHKQVIDSDRLEKEIKKVERVIRRLIQENIVVVTFITVDKFNFFNLKKILNKAIELKTFPIIERYLPVKDEKTNFKFLLTKQEWYAALKMIKEIYSKYHRLVNGKAYTRGKVCSCFTDNLSITPDGYVLPCPFVPVSLSLGDLKEESLKRIWEKFLKKRKEWEKIPVDCKGCKNKYLCRGGCKATLLLLKRDISKKDSLCNGEIPTTLGHAAFSILHNNKSIELKRLN